MPHGLHRVDGGERLRLRNRCFERLSHEPGQEGAFEKAAEGEGIDVHLRVRRRSVRLALIETQLGRRFLAQYEMRSLRQSVIG